jgi:hypothetical protein
MINNSISYLAGAIAAGKNKKLFEWTITYLQTEERNKELLEIIQKRKIVKAELIEFPLSRLERVTGPQNGETEPESLPQWLKRVKALEEAINNRHLPPPIIVTDFWQELIIADGNHRHEALLKCGFTTYWTIFLLENHSSADKLLKKS